MLWCQEPECTTLVLSTESWEKDRIRHAEIANFSNMRRKRKNHVFKGIYADRLALMPRSVMDLILVPLPSYLYVLDFLKSVFYKID